MSQAALLQAAAGKRMVLVWALLIAAASNPGSRSGFRSGFQGLDDPFAKGLRWEAGASQVEPWIPLGVSFAAGGELVLVAAGVGSPHLQLASASAFDPAGAMLEALQEPAALSSSMDVVSGESSERMFALFQFPAPSPLQRRTEIRAYRASSGLGAELWSHDPGPIGNTKARLTCDANGQGLLLALETDAGVQLQWLHEDTGNVTEEILLPAFPLNAVCTSMGARRVAVIAGSQLWVLNELAEVVHHENLAFASSALALDSQGETLAVGAFGSLRVLCEFSGAYLECNEILGGRSELPTKLALSDNGERLAVGWWDFAGGVNARGEFWDLAGTTRLAEINQPGVAGGLQNFPIAARVTPDGARAAFGFWGGNASHELLLVDAGGQVVLSADLAGSVQALDLDATGTRLIVGAKDGHANQFSTTGKVLQFDTGERDVQVQAVPQAGGLLELVAKRSDSLFGVYLLGSEVQGLPPVPGWGGLPMLDPFQPLFTFARSADAEGVVHLPLPLPDDPSLTGFAFQAQVLFAMPAGLHFSTDLARVLILP